MPEDWHGGSQDPELTRTFEPTSGDDGGPRAWGDLRLLDEIGRGGFGRVYRAWDDSLPREVALKVIKPRDAHHRSAPLGEGRLLARVRHANVVTVYRAQQIGDEIGLTMELIRGLTLADVIRQGGPMGAEEATLVGLRLCHALAAVHGAGLLHRDVKAQNVMRESGGRIVLMDFGSGREMGPWDAVGGGAAEISGTPLYLAPELFEGRAASPASDLYSPGVLLFYLVTRQYPVEGATLAALAHRHKQGGPRRPADLRPDLPDAFVHVVHRALSRAPEQRAASAGAMLAELADTIRGDAQHATAITTAADDRDTGRVRREAPAPPWRRTVSGATLGAGIIVGAWLLGLLTSAHYNRAMGRDAGFSDDTIWTWLEMGFRSLVPPVIYLVVLFMIAWIISAIWHFVQRLGAAGAAHHGLGADGDVEAGGRVGIPPSRYGAVASDRGHRIGGRVHALYARPDITVSRFVIDPVVGFRPGAILLPDKPNQVHDFLARAIEIYTGAIIFPQGFRVSDFGATGGPDLDGDAEVSPHGGLRISVVF